MEKRKSQNPQKIRIRKVTERGRKNTWSIKPRGRNRTNEEITMQADKPRRREELLRKEEPAQRLGEAGEAYGTPQRGRRRGED